MISTIVNKKFGGLLLLIILSAITHWHWLVLPGIFTSGDFWYIHDQFFRESLTIPKILDTVTTLGAGVATPTFNILNIVGGLLVKVHLGFAAWERILFLWPIALLAPIPIYLFLLRTVKHPAAAFAGSAVYIFNTYLLARETVHMHIAIVYLLAPALFLAFEDLVKKQSKKSILVFFTLSAICSVFEIRILYICSLILTAYGIYLLITKTIRPSWKLVGVCALVIVPLAAVQSYWLLPFIFVKSSLGYDSITGRSLFQSFAHIPEAITISEPFWTGAQLTDFIPQHVPWWAYSIPIAAFLWILFKTEGRKNHFFWFWALVAVVGIFLVKESNNPFPSVYMWLFTHIPGFRLFRDASKFNLITGLSYAILIAGSLAIIQKRFAPASYILGGLLAGTMLINTVPFITGSIASMTVPYEMLPQFSEVQRMLEANTSFGRTMWVPTDERFMYESQTHPRLSLVNLASADWLPFVQNSSDPFTLISQPIFKSLLNMTSIRYIGEPSQAIEDVYRWYGKSKSTFTSLIATVPGLQKIESAPQDIPMWENKEAKPLIYLADNVVAVHGPLQDFSGIDPSPTTAFIFQPDVSENLFKDAIARIATNSEFIPFLPDNLFVGQERVTTHEVIPDASLTHTITRASSADTIAQLYIQNSDQTLTLIARTPSKETTLATTTNTKQDFVIQINGKRFFYTHTDETKELFLGAARLHEEKNDISFYGKISSDPLIADPSFEDGTWGNVGDCNNQNSSTADANRISTSQSKESTNGSFSLSLAAGKHIACVNTTISSVPIPALYIGSFDYQLVQGDPGYIKILQNDPSEQLTLIQLANTSTWQHEQFSFRTDGTHTMSIYLYQPGNDTLAQPSKGLFDNFQISAYQPMDADIKDATFPQQTATTTTPYQEQDSIITEPMIDGDNLLSTSTFSSNNPLSAGDCDNEDSTPPKNNGIKATIVKENNTAILSLEAKKHIACLTLPIASFDPTYDHLLSVTYKTAAGTSPHIALYPNSDPANATVYLPTTNGAWKTYNTIIQGNGISDNAGLMLYVPANTEYSKSFFSSISLVRIPILPTKFIQTTGPSLPSLTTEVKTTNPTLHALNIADLGTKPRLLVLSNRFDTGWKVFVRQQDAPNLTFWQRIMFQAPGTEISSASHIKVNGFENGWTIDPQEIQSLIGSQQNVELVLEYWPQRYMDIGTILSITTFVLYTGIMTIIPRRHEKV